ncbi:flagellar motor protein MotB [Curvivirga sp.]|uniref:flagellar motor protein MotB n=1 Tax=Curvivirga sp. TaxID=2856848 RepID=UPI003B58F724
MSDEDQPVIFKVKKIAEDGAHGGAWKIAYADFVTAMMAFFLLLWLLNATEEEVLKGVSSYFTPTTKKTADPSGAGGMFGGITSAEPGPEEEKLHTAADISAPRDQGLQDSETEGSGTADEESTGSQGRLDPIMEDQNFYGTKELMEAALDNLPPELKDLKQSIKIDVTDEGLRVQMLDQEKLPLFEHKSAKLTEHGIMLLRFIAQYGERLPNPVSVTGHTDGAEEKADQWKLSVDRAGSARRQLQKSGITPRRFQAVVGKASYEPLDADNPGAPANRRVVIVYIRQATDKVTGKPETGSPSLFNPDEAPQL